MQFPTDLKTLSDEIKYRHDVIDALKLDIAELAMKVKRKQVELDFSQEVSSILEELLLASSYFFLSIGTQQRVVAKELLRPDAVPQKYPVVPLASVRQETCSACHQSHPVIECYDKIYDGPAGDIWSQTRWLLCLVENKKFELKAERQLFRC